ncbi:MAG: polysaccharide biosynthesis/export family protein [Nodosilinea sp.]
MINPARFSVSVLVLGGMMVGYMTPVIGQEPLNPPTTPGRALPSTSPRLTEESVQQAEDNAYVLGPGDIIRFDIFNVPELTNDQSGNRLVVDNLYNVLVDGTVNLPWVGRVPVRGLNLEEAAREIEQQYQPFILDPVVTLTLFTPRPVRIAVVGEVKRPGAYSSDQADTPDTDQPNPRELRTVVQAIQTAGGITQLADIREIEVRRPQIDGSEKVIPVDFFALLEDGSQSQNLLLRDGDTVFIPTATALDPEAAQALAAANFAPDVVGVDVVGEVDSPGRVEIKPNSTLNQAILAAGGFDDPRAETGKVALIRLNPDGTVTNREISVDLSAGINEENNPSLQENDVVIVSRRGVTRTADFLELIGTAAGAVINPIVGIVGILNLFNND